MFAGASPPLFSPSPVGYLSKRGHCDHCCADGQSCVCGCGPDQGKTGSTALLANRLTVYSVAVETETVETKTMEYGLPS